MVENMEKQITLNEQIKEALKEQKRIQRCLWTVGVRDRGLGRCDFAVITRKTGTLVVECLSHDLAGHIVEAHNEFLKKKRI